MNNWSCRDGGACAQGKQLERALLEARTYRLALQGLPAALAACDADIERRWREAYPPLAAADLDDEDER